jgi:hypothetical protein
MCRSTLTTLGAVALTLLFSTPASAYETYSTDGETGNCASCHGDFNGENYVSNSDGTAWNDHLMDGHKSFIDDSGNDQCNVCHSGNNRCHGREEDITANDGVFGGTQPGRGDGLRLHHMLADGYLNWPGGIPGSLTCAQCHSADTAPVAENVLPFNYSLAGTLIDPCTSENMFGSTGLDNDGDGNYDTADSDCNQSEPFTKLIALTDVDSSGNTDVALLRTGSVIAEVRDGQAGSLINTLYFFGAGFTPVTGVALSDADSNGVTELAVLAVRNSDGRMVVEIRNVTGVAAARQIWFAAGHAPVGMAVIEADADGNGVPELAVLSTRGSDGRVLVEIKNAFGATNTNALWPEPGLDAADPGAYTASDIEIVPDADNNGVPEVAVLLTRISDSRIVVDIKNAAGTVNSHDVWFMPGNTAIDLTVVADKDANNIPEVAVLSSRDSDGRNVVEIKNASGATSSSTVWFAPGFSAKQVNAVNDADSNGVPEVAVGSIRDSDSRILVEVKNVTGATNTNQIWYSAGFTGSGMMILNDADNNSIAEVGVLMIRDSDSRVLVQGRNASGSPEPNNYWFSL